MRISLLEIENFRGIRLGKIKLHEHTVLIGANNSGKTTIIEALALVLGRDRLIRNLTEHDFYGSTPQPADRIKITATVTGFEPEEFTEHPEWFGDQRGIPLWFDPQSGEVLPEQTTSTQRLACQIVFVARFDIETLEVETARYFNDGDPADVLTDQNYVTVPGKLIRDMGFFLVPASRSWDRMLSFNSELFRRVIRSAGGLPAETVIDERQRLRAPEHALEDDTRLSPIVAQVNREISTLLGKSKPLKLRLTTTDSIGVLETVMPHFQTDAESVIPAKREGSGLVSLQSLFLLLHFGQKRIEDGESFLMALEEPELHLPPAVQRRVLSRLQALSTQTIVTTHSPLIAAYCDASSLISIHNDEGLLGVRPMLAERLGQDATNAVRRLFQINRVETAAAMMSDVVLVPEGRLDFDWLTLLLRIAELAREGEPPCLFGVRIGLVPTSDARVRETCEALGKAHPHVVALVDGDSDGNRYADRLEEPGAGAEAVLCWPAGWTIEDVIGWIISADESAVMARAKEDLAEAPPDRQTMVKWLKTPSRQSHGLKGDGVAYEIIANAISERPMCRARSVAMLNDMAEACLGNATPLFTAQQPRHGPVQRFVFTP